MCTRASIYMATSKAKKEETLSDLKAAFTNGASATFVSFAGVDVASSTDLRRSLAGEGVSYQVAKKTLIAKAVQDGGFSGDMPELPGNIAVTVSQNDPTASARVLYNWFNDKKEMKELFTIVGGIYEGKLMNATEMQAIATIPDIKTLRGMFVNIINSPIQSMVIALSKIAEAK